MTLHPTRRLQDGRYILLGLLRTGGEAEVWRALDTVAGEQRALKVWLAADGGAEAAARELELARRVVHPHVVRVDDAFVDGDHAFVVMELAEGSLAERVATMGPLTPDEAFAALEGPLQALEAAHAAGIVHRDVKPHNLLVFGALDGALDGALERDGGGRPRAVVKLADFGIAQVRAEGLTRTRSGAFLGSLPFMSPEQRRDPRNVGPATDVYAAAVTLAWLVTGKAPGDLYLPETLEELRAELRGRGLEKREIERVVGVVEAGGRLEANQRIPVNETAALVWETCAATGDLIWADSPRQNAARNADTLRARNAMTAQHSKSPTSFRLGRLSWQVVAGASAATGLGISLLAAYVRDTPSGRTSRGDATNGIAMCESALTHWVADRRMGPHETTNAAVADVDGDGFSDALFTNQYDETVSIWYGPELGRSPPERVSIGRAFMPVAVGDVDGDEVNDIVAARPDRADIAILSGRATGGFAPVRELSESTAAEAVAILDWNLDGRNEIAFRHRDGISLRLDTLPDSPDKAAAARHKNIAQVGPGTLLATWTGEQAPGLVYDTPSGDIDVVSPAPGGARQHTIVHDRLRLGERFVVADVDADGRSELYRTQTDGTLVRLAVAGRQIDPCVMALSMTDLAAALVPGTKAGTWGAVAFDSCTGCESNHIFLTGSP